jgi:phenylalanyl-tRNA synthetase beta chain
MNILVSYNWLKDYVEIKDSPKELARKLSLCGPSVERIIKKKDDYIFDTEITTNRPDVLSIIGFAREVSAITGEKLLKKCHSRNEFGTSSEPARSANSVAGRLVSGSVRFRNKFGMTKKNQDRKTDLQFQIQDKKNCPRYMAIVLDNIKVESSPWWMQKRLLSYGVRPINNIVDITNFVMLEYGQPMHAFDYDKLENSKFKTQNFAKTIIARKAKEGEEIITLDGEKKKLNSEMLIIADAKKPIAVAGIMGGKFSAVDSKTKRIVLEAANFNEISIRKTARALNLYSESSTRFEKGLSGQLPLPAMARAVELVQNLTEANIASTLIDKGIKKYQQTKIKLSKKNVELFLGVKIPSQKIIKILNSLGFDIEKKGDKGNKENLGNKKNKGFVVSVPFWRDKDVRIEVDLIEEIARIYGYYKLPIELPTGKIPQKEKNWQLYWENKTKEILSGAGMTEIYSYSFISKEFLEKAGIDSKKRLKLLNPLNADLEYMRPNLIPSLLQVIFQNQKIKDKFEIFELANIYLSKGFNKLPDEKLALCGAIIQESIKKQKLFYKIKGIVELLFEKIGIDVLTVSYKPLAVGRFWHPTKAAKILIKNQQVGIIGEIHPEILTKFDINMPVAMFDFDFSKLIKYATTNRTYQPIIKFPPVKLDLAIVIDKKILWNDIQKLIYQTGENFVKKVELFDVYEGRGVPINKKSLAFHITYQADDRTLKDKEVNEIQEKITKVLEKKLEAEVRGVV